METIYTERYRERDRESERETKRECKRDTERGGEKEEEKVWALSDSIGCQYMFFSLGKTTYGPCTISLFLTTVPTAFLASPRGQPN